jgi:MOSC domain-containing protein YiiM
MRIRNLYISPGHRFFGHHGKPPGEAVMVRLPEVQCLAGRGLEGDRFLDYKENYKGQITFFSLAVYERLCKQLDVSDREPSVLRRNVIVSEVDLNSLIGQEFTVQGVHFHGTEEAKPCYWMNQAFAEGAEAALKGHGGLRARILSDGILREE